MTKISSYKKLYDIAENQAGYFSTRQAEANHCSKKNLYILKKGGKLKRIEWGIYRFTYFPSSPYEDLFLAILKTSGKSVLSHETALSVYELSDTLPGEINIIIPKTHSRRRQNIKYHIQKITDDEITKYKGLPITTVERTIIDVLNSGGDIIQVNKAIIEALNRGMTTKAQLLAQTQRSSPKTQRLYNELIKGLNN